MEVNFCTHKATPWLDGKHTVFGKKVIKGQDVVDAIEKDDLIKKLKIIRKRKKCQEMECFRRL